MTPNREDYLKIILELGGDTTKVNNKQIVSSLDVSAASVSEMISKLLKEELVDYVGTDAHRCEHSRIPKMKECTQLLYKKYDEAYVDSILYGNAFDRLLTDTNTLKENR